MSFPEAPSFAMANPLYSNTVMAIVQDSHLLPIYAFSKSHHVHLIYYKYHSTVCKKCQHTKALVSESMCPPK